MLSKAKNWRSRFLPGLMSRTYQQADVIVAVSQELRDDLAAVANIPQQRIQAIYNPVVGPRGARGGRRARAPSLARRWPAARDPRGRPTVRPKRTIRA